MKCIKELVFTHIGIQTMPLEVQTHNSPYIALDIDLKLLSLLLGFE